MAASVLHEPVWPEHATKDLSDDHFDYEEGGIDPTLLAEAKERALLQLENFGVYEIVPKEQTKGKHILPSGWTPGVVKPREVNIRFVVEEMKWWEQRDDLFTQGSLGATVRVIDFYALQHGYACFIMDCTSAFYHADEPEEVYVRPPPEWIAKQIEADLPDDVMWRLRNQLPGRRAAGQRWVDHAADLLTDEGMTRCVECPCFFQSLNGVVIELHMDDFHGAGPLEACSKIIEQLKKHFRRKVSPLLEPEVRHQLLRRHRVMTLDRTFIDSERRRIDNVLHALGLDAANSVPTPSLAPGQNDGEPLTAEQPRLYRSCVGSLLCINHDRPDILRDIGLLSGRLSAPRDIDIKRFVRVAR